MTDHRTIHRLVPATEKHGHQTACGIRVSEVGPEWLEKKVAKAEDGGFIKLTGKGEAFDCKRCTAVIEQFRKGRMLP
jgi:hypothetical protein